MVKLDFNPKNQNEKEKSEFENPPFDLEFFSSLEDL